MNILLLSPFFYPEPISTGKYNTDFVKSLVKKGHNITVICSHPIYPNWKVKVVHNSIEGVEIIRGGNYMKYPKNNVLRRFFLELWFAFFVTQKVIFSKRKIDIIIPVFPPSLAFSFIVKILPKQVKKHAIVHDLQSVFINNSTSLYKKFISSCIKNVEKFGFNSCDKIILLSNEMKCKVNDEYGINISKLVVQYPFSNLSDVITNDLSNIFDNKYKHVVYSGALGEKQNPNDLMSFFSYASKNIKNVKFHVFSSGSEYNLLKQKNINKSILFHPLVPFENVRELYSRSDVQIIPQKPGTSSGSLPSKLPNLVAANCKVLLITDKDSEIQQLFNKYRFGRVINKWNNKLLCDELKKMLFELKGEKKNNSKFVNDLFSIEALITKII